MEKCGMLEFENSTMSATPQLGHNTPGAAAVNTFFPWCQLVTCGLLHAGGQRHPFEGTGSARGSAFIMNFDVFCTLVAWQRHGCSEQRFTCQSLASAEDLRWRCRCSSSARGFRGRRHFTTLASSRTELSVFHREQVRHPGASRHNPQMRKLLRFLPYNLIRRPTSAFATCPNCVEMSSSVLVQFCFSGAVTATFHHFHDQDGFEEHAWLWSGWPFRPGIFDLGCFPRFTHFITCICTSFIFFHRD